MRSLLLLPKCPGHLPSTLFPPSNPGRLQQVGSAPTRMGCVRLYHPAHTCSLHCIQYGTKLQGTVSLGPKILGQDPIPSMECLAAKGSHGPSVLQLQKLSVCRKSGSNLGLAQTQHEVTAINELNDQINVQLPLSLWHQQGQMQWDQLFSDN